MDDNVRDMLEIASNERKKHLRPAPLVVQFLWRHRSALLGAGVFLHADLISREPFRYRVLREEELGTELDVGQAPLRQGPHGPQRLRDHVSDLPHR